MSNFPKPKVRVFDLESNGLLRHMIRPEETPMDRVHVLVVHDYFANWYHRYRQNDVEDSIRRGIEELAEADLVVGHNIIGFDLPAMAETYGLHIDPAKVIDTLVLSRLMYSNMSERDGYYVRNNKLPGRLFGSHSLESWGYRLGVMKGEYQGDMTILDESLREAMKWSKWNQDMDDYGLQDVVVTRALFDHLLNDGYYFNFDDMEGDAITREGALAGAIDAVKLEHQAAFLMAKQQQNGFPFNEQAAGELYATLAARRVDLTEKVAATFSNWYAPKGGKTPFLHPKTGRPLSKYPAVVYPKTGDLYLKDGKKLSKTPYFKDAPYTPVEYIEFNPGSRDHIAKVLMDNGWEPEKFTEGGKPMVDEEVLGSVRVADPEAQAAVDLIAEYLLVSKRIGQIAEGKQAWLRYVKNGMIHGAVNPNGAVTGRATHSSPNVAQTPAGGAPWGKECRALWGAQHYRHVWPQATQVGTDASGLELRCLGHFMARFDHGEYIEAVVNGDVHWKNALASGLAPAGTVRDKHNDVHDGYRNNAKTFIYAFLYGAGDEKIGKITNGGKAEGKALKTKFLAATPAIKSLRESIEGALVESAKWVNGSQQIKWKRKWLKGLDGRKLHVRSPHSALNTLLQSAGALICKKWIVEIELILLDQGLKHGTGKDDDFFFMAWVHDEVQICCRTPEIAKMVEAASVEAMARAEAFFDFRCPLGTEAKIGDTWLECH